MTTQHVISGVTFPNPIAIALPAIAGLQVLAFFGTGGDGINTNRAPGGQAFTGEPFRGAA
jgi:hypothetical protein